MDVAVFASASVRAFGHLGSLRALTVVLGGGSVAPPGRLGSVKVRVGARLHARRCEGVRFGPFSKKCPFPTTFHKTGDRLCLSGCAVLREKQVFASRRVLPRAPRWGNGNETDSRTNAVLIH